LGHLVNELIYHYLDPDVLDWLFASLVVAWASGRCSWLGGPFDRQAGVWSAGERVSVLARRPMADAI
jgi:hypothetical protein